MEIKIMADCEEDVAVFLAVCSAAGADVVPTEKEKKSFGNNLKKIE